MTLDRWAAADVEAELTAAERDVEAVGLGPARAVELTAGAVAVLDAVGRVHALVRPRPRVVLREAA